PEDRRNWEWNYLKRQCHAELMTIPAHECGIRTVALSPDGRWIVTGGEEEGAVRVWDAGNGREVRTLLGHRSSIFSVSISPDGTRVASAGGFLNRPEQVLIHDLDTGRTLTRLTSVTGQQGSVSFSSDGRRLVIASGELNAVVDGKDTPTGW